MAIRSAEEYVGFFAGLKMGPEVSLLSFASNERMALKQRLGRRGQDPEAVARGIEILERIIREVGADGEDAVLRRYGGR